jgi:methionyl-tRNA formyltransferase
MRVGFAGTPAFAATALHEILASGFPVALVLTRPDRPRGRGLQVQPSPVKELALAHGIPVRQPATLKAPDSRGETLAVPLDVLVVAAYGLILPPEVLAWPRYGCINIHASLLPRWRGAAPIERALLEGDRETGISLIQSGSRHRPADRHRSRDDRGRRLRRHADRAARAGRRDGHRRALGRLRDAGALAATPQPEAGRPTRQDRKVEAQIDWTASAVAIARRVAPSIPRPGQRVPGLAQVDPPASRVLSLPVPRTLQGVCSKPARRASSSDAATVPCACSSHACRGRAMSAAAFVAGRGVAVGDTFAAPPAH